MAIRDGIVREIGTHDALMQKEGLYHSLVMAQVGAQISELMSGPEIS